MPINFMKNHQLKNADCSFVFFRYAMVILLSAYFTPELAAQTDPLTRSQKADSALVKAINMYDNEVGRNSFLYTGRVYHDKYGSIQGHQFFAEDYWEQSEIVYDGQYFDSVYLMYDIYNDLILLEHFNSNGLLSPIKLHNPKISSFTIQGYSFVKLEKDTISGKPNGFYNEIFLGDRIAFYVLRKKEISKSNDINSVQEIFTEKDKYYFKLGEVFYQIRKKGKILKVLADHKKEIKGFMKSNLLLYRQNPERVLTEVAQYYESLF
jgi:hypothetical protein